MEGKLRKLGCYLGSGVGRVTTLGIVARYTIRSLSEEEKVDSRDERVYLGNSNYILPWFAYFICTNYTMIYVIQITNNHKCNHVDRLFQNTNRSLSYFVNRCILLGYAILRGEITRAASFNPTAIAHSPALPRFDPPSCTGESSCRFKDRYLDKENKFTRLFHRDYSYIVIPRRVCPASTRPCSG